MNLGTIQRKSDSELRTLRASLTALREEHADLQDAHSSLSRATSQTIASQKSQLTTLTHQTTLLTSELAESKFIADERNLTIQSLQDQLDELNGTQDSLRDVRRGADEDTWSVVREELHRQADYLRTLEGTNAKMNMELNGLRERQASVEVLKEEKRGLERKVKLLEELREKVVKLEAEVEAGRREREEWSV
jgi:mitotic spindle assembly checkpoint protein MAD1